jgi:hypothetical protein
LQRPVVQRGLWAILTWSIRFESAFKNHFDAQFKKADSGTRAIIDHDAEWSPNYSSLAFFKPAH